MFKSTYLMESMYFDTFEELKNYYNHPECEDLWDLDEALRHEYDGMAYPEIVEMDV